MISSFKKWLLRLPILKNFYASQIKRYRTQIVVQTLSLAHAQELAQAPGENWPQIKERQAREILAVRDGKLDIVDRRSYQWPYLPLSIGRTPQPVIKFSPSNIRRFAKTPVPRRAINLIKGAVLSLSWDIVPIEGDAGASNQDIKQRIKAAKNALKHPNNCDTWQTLMEVGIDDFCTLGAMVLEPQLTPDVHRPFKVWNVDSATIRIYPSWTESTPDKPRYAQMMGILSDNGAIPFLDEELLYLRDNPTVDSPFGMGKMEIAFEHVSALIGVQRMAAKAGADASHRTWFWWEQGNVQQSVEVIRRHLNNDIEGQSRIPLISGIPRPEVITVTPVEEADLMLQWQEMCVRMIGNAFDLSAMALGVERDVNRSTGEVLDDKDFRSAVVPVAIRVAEAMTNFFLHRLLGWKDLAFKFNNLEDPDMSTKLTQVSQLWNMNAVTPNQVLDSLGKPRLTSPYADLTQFEMSLILAEATAKLADSNAANASQRQMDQQQQMMEQMQQQQQSQDPDDQEQQQPQAAGAATPAPKTGLKPLTKLKGLKKSPMPGSKVNAKQVAAMSKQQLVAAMKRGDVTADVNQLADQMQQQEPGILLELAPDIIEYLQQLKQAQTKKDRSTQVKPSAKAIANQKARYRKGVKKQQTFNQKRSHPEI